MGAPKGNRFWELRSKHGRDKLFATPELLWDAAVEYFEWCNDNPLYESKAFAFQGEITMATLPKMRAFTLGGLCLYLDCSVAYFRTFKSLLQEKDKDFLTVINKIEETIYNQKFTGAAADLLNPNIIARDLGLSEKNENRFTDKEGNDLPVQIIQLPDNGRNKAPDNSSAAGLPDKGAE